MTTVTEAAKLLVGTDDEKLIKSGDLEKICANPAVARRLARRLAEAAREISPGREWSVEDLRDLLDAATGESLEQARIVEGRHFRKHLRAHCNIAARQGSPCACVVVALAPEREPGTYARVMDGVAEKLRRTDLAFVYKRRYALILPRITPSVLGPLLDRVKRLVVLGAGADAIQAIHATTFPDPTHLEVQSVLDWAEDRLREE